MALFFQYMRAGPPSPPEPVLNLHRIHPQGVCGSYYFLEFED
jgi:hypothetical protein